jgi:hypothetical protein
MIYWTIRTFDKLTTCGLSETNWINNHIHDSTQILDVICENEKTISASVVINGRLRDIELILYLFNKQNRNFEEMVDFIKAYDEWYELYKVPILANSESIVLSDAYIVHHGENTLLSKMIQFISCCKMIKAKKISYTVYPVENDLIV